MRKKELGSTGLEITPVGIGAFALGGKAWEYGWGQQSDVDSISAIRAAIESGVNWIDTAAVYSLGHSEQLVSEAISVYSESDRPYVLTKCGITWNEGGQLNFSSDPRSMVDEVEDSLRRLNTDCIDLLQIHWPSKTGIPVEHSWEALLKMKAQGKIRYAGVSNFNRQQLETCEQIGHVDSLQPPLSLINDKACADILPWCKQHGTGVIGYSPLQSGLLTGKYNTENIKELPLADWRQKSDEFLSQLEQSVALMPELKQVALEKEITLIELAIAWVLEQEGVSGAIVGARNPDQVKDWINVPDISLETSILDKIDEVLSNSKA